MQVNNIRQTCPLGSKIEYENATTVGAYNIGILVLNNELPDMLSFYILKYRCIQCDKEMYTLEHGEITVIRNNNTIVSKIEGTDIYDGVLSSHDVVIERRTLLRVSLWRTMWRHNRGRCKANYWGMLHQKQVKFYRCPESYCCTEPSGCKEYMRVVYKDMERYVVDVPTATLKQCFLQSVMQNKDCHDIWLFPYTVTLALIYALLLLFQNDLKKFLFSAHLGKTSLKNIWQRKQMQCKVTQI